MTTSKRGYVKNINNETVENTNFRKVVYTGAYSQLVLMSIPAGGEIGTEVHGNDQFFRIDQGKGEVIINGETSDIEDDFGIVVPAGAEHNIRNTGNIDLKLYTIYSVPHHKDGKIHSTKEEAQKDNDDEFDGSTTE